MTIGQTLHGFTLVSITPVAEMSANVHLFRHEKTGAQLLWTGRADSNKTFSVAFQTLPEDDTGVFHILEHSVLCGSAKYPVKEPFVELLKGSMNTFLNAMTFPDKTMYPVSSQNDADFRNLMHVYLDAVFAPAIYNNKNIFLQEGWHYEPGEDGKPGYVGVVFGEMKGAFSSVDEVVMVNLNRMLYPDSIYGFVSGGDPEHIPELTYEQFISAHQRYYHPSNAYFFLDGSVNLEQALADIEELYLCRYERREPDFALTMQQPIPYTTKTVEYEIAPGEDKTGKAHFVMGRIAASWQEVEKLVAIHVLEDYLASSNQAPLTRKILERGLGQDLQFGVMDGIAQPFMMLHILNCNDEKLPTMEAEIRAIVEEILAEGLDKDELIACLNKREFKSKEPREPYGIELAIEVTNSWMYGGDATMYLATDAIFASLREKLDTDYYAELLRQLLLGQEGMAVMQVLPSDTLGQQKRDVEQAKLDAAFAGWTDDDKQALAQQQEKLVAWQQSVDSAEALATIPHLDVKDLSTEPAWTGVAEETLAGIRVLKPNVESGTVYLNLFFELPGISFEDLPAVSLMTTLMGVLPTAERSAQLVQRDIKTHLGTLRFALTPVAAPGDCDHCKVYLHGLCSVLPHNTAEAVRIIKEVLLHTDFNQPELVKQTLQQAVIGMQQGIIMGGHQAAFRHALAGQTAEENATEHTTGYTAYIAARDTAAAFDEKFPLLLEAFRKVQKCFTAAGLTIGVTGNMDNAQLEDLCRAFPAGEKADSTLTFSLQENRRDAISIPAGIAFAVRGGNLYRLGYEPHGSMQLMSKLLSLNYLWNEVRVQGGAYGAGLAVRDNGSIFSYSYRDPNPARSLDIYNKAAAFLRSFCENKEDFNQLMIGAVSDSEPLLSAKDKSTGALVAALRGITQERKRLTRKQLLETTYEDLLRCCQLLEKLAQQGDTCVVGADPLLDACGDNLQNRLSC